MATPTVQTFGKYQILERIATGGMAEIYRARLEGIGGFQRVFAIKRVLPHLSQNAEYVAMLVDEAKVAGLLSHANIVQILDLGQVDGVWYIAMEYVHGRDLGAVLKRCRERGLRLPVPHTVFVALELLKALEYAHQRQVMRGGRPVPLHIIHRDVSPPNILLAFQGEVKLTDFGIARASLKVMETQAGVIKGRFDYMSPEQAAGAKDLDQRSDLFSVGVVLYEMLTGQHPFRADSELQTLENVRLGKYEPVSGRNPDVPFSLETIVDRALQVDRDARYPSATAFKEALDKFFHDAGFIFTHSTLAAYVKGLFPEVDLAGANRESARATPPAPPPVPEPEEEGFPTDAHTDEVDRADADGPTRLMDRRLVDEELARQAAPVSTFGPAPGDEETQVRRNPLLPRPVEWADEQETVIRRSLVPAPEDGPDDPPTDIDAMPADLDVDEEPPRAREPSVERAPAPPVDRAPAANRPGGRVGLLAAGGASAFALGLGALFGAALGALALWSALPWIAPIHDTRARSTLEVVAPEHATVTVNGIAFAGEVDLPPGQPQRVQVALDGYTPWVQQVTVEPGETMVILIRAEALVPVVP